MENDNAVGYAKLHRCIAMHPERQTPPARNGEIHLPTSGVQQERVCIEVHINHVSQCIQGLYAAL